MGMPEHDLATETLLTLKAASRRFPGDKGHGLHINSIRRWARAGVRGVKLATVAIGGRIYTSVEELARFRLAVEAARERQRCLPEHLRLRLPPTPARARRNHERAAKFLGRRP